MKVINLSIIIPAFQPNEIIFQVLDSVGSLSENLSLELILIRNGPPGKRVSDANLKSALDKYSFESTFISLDLPNVSNARNAGASIANGEFLKFLDADDILFPAETLKHYELIASSGFDIITSNHSIIRNGRIEEKNRIVRSIRQGLFSGDIGITSGALFRSEIFGNVAWRKEKRFNEEKWLYFDALQTGYSIYHLSSSTFLKHELPSSLSQNARESGEDVIEILQFRVHLFKVWQYSLSAGERVAGFKAIRNSIISTLQSGSMKGVLITTKILLQRRIPLSLWSKKHQFGMIIFTPLFFPLVFSCKEKLNLWRNNESFPSKLGIRTKM